ncbi:MAG: heparinase II/III family protein [Cyclobacteriaceae bacterium]|nr:heparinase II/III family protein [Cyclobacteriaceae bacterium]
MKNQFNYLLLLILTVILLPGLQAQDHDLVKLENPISEQYLKKKLQKSAPRLILNTSIEKKFKAKLNSDPMVKNYYQALKLNAEQIQTEPLLSRVMIGRRLLSTSREMLQRMTILGMVYRIERDPKLLKRIEDEIKAVCNFTNWNPSHYLDVAEMSLAVAIAIDWVGEDLTTATVELAKASLIEKGIKPSYNKQGNTGWINGINNWNQVCHGGMIAAAIVTADKDPQLAAQTIHRALEGIPYALAEYGPDGVYPEGSTYWEYGTSFSVITSSMLESAFGTDFGLAEYPSFKASAVFRKLSIAPSGWYYNFADCGDKSSENGDITLAWFAAQTGNPLYLEQEKFMRNPADMGQLPRLAGAGLVWLAEFEPKTSTTLPLAWKGDGANPIVIFRGPENDTGQFYFGGKGGRGTSPHGNMDAGSFIMELDGVRWVVDPGNQSYNALEITGFDLWGRCQECERWTLLTKNNYGHSTLTVNNKLHVADGFASLIDFKTGEKPEATFDMSEVFGEDLKNTTRRFIKENNRSVLIEDHFETTPGTNMITWQLMTTADVDITKNGALLSQEGKTLKMEILSHPEIGVSIISLQTPPLKLDRKIDHLKRIEIRLPAYLFKDGKGTISVRLTGEL